jgi:hypothetical protein
LLPFTSLDAVTATGVGEERDLETSLRYHTAHLVTTGSPSSVDVALQGSLDGTNWVHLATLSAGALVTSNNHVVRYIRAELHTLSGGSSPTVTVKIASA